MTTYAITRSQLTLFALLPILTGTFSLLNFAIIVSLATGASAHFNVARGQGLS